MSKYAALSELPTFAVGSNGRPTLDLYASTALGDSQTVLDGQRITGIRVFRAGKFKNSDGVESKWSVADLKAMVSNFHELRGNGILPHIPVRENHSRDIRSVVGYFADLRVEGQFLVADLDLTEPDAQQRYARGTYRARSLEVGGYETNDGEVYYPTVMGLAFCDIPAVEGLYAAAMSAYEKGDLPEVRQFAAPAATAKTKAAPAAGQADPADQNGVEGEPEFSSPGEALKDILIDLHELKDLLAGDPDSEATLQRIVDAITAFSDDLNNPGDGSDDPAQGANAKTGKAPANHTSKSDDTPSPEAPKVALIKFALNGAEYDVDETAKPVLDAFAAQNATLVSQVTAATEQISALQAAATESAYAVRDSVVDRWLSDKKIAPAEVEAQKAFCRTLSDEQFAAHKAMKDSAAVLSFTAPVGTGAPEQDAEKAKAEKVAEYSKTLRMMHLAGVTGDAYSNSKPFKALVALGVTPEGI